MDIITKSKKYPSIEIVERKDTQIIAQEQVIQDLKSNLKQLSVELEYAANKWKQAIEIGLDAQKKQFTDDMIKILKYAKWYWFKYREDKDKCIWAGEKCAEALCQIDDLRAGREMVSPSFIDHYEEFKEEIEEWYNGE